MLIKYTVEAVSSDIIKSAVDTQAGSDATSSANERLIKGLYSTICRTAMLRFLVLFIAMALISAPPRVFSMEKPDDNAIFVAGFEAYRHKNYSLALQNFNSLLDKYPDTPLVDVTLFWISSSYYKIGDQMESARYMSRLIKQYPDTPMRAFVEDDVLVLVSRYEKGERLPTHSTKAGVPGGDRTSAPLVTLEASKAATPLPVSNSDNVPPPVEGSKNSVASSTNTAKQTVVAATPLSASQAGPPQPIEQAAARPVKAKSTIHINEIKTGESNIDIVTGSRLEGYKTFQLLHPGRLVIDIPGAKSEISAKSISIKRLGISKVRVGTTRAAARIVLDAARSPFPAYEIKPFEDGLRITILPPTKDTSIPASNLTAAEPRGSDRAVPAVAASRGKSTVHVKEITAGESYIDIVTDSPLNNYKAFKLPNPGRLIIDIPNAKNAIDAQSISIKHLGISKVRIGSTRAAVRVVLDAAQSPFPEYDIKATENGLRITIK
jgi:hypothetical protein